MRLIISKKYIKQQLIRKNQNISFYIINIYLNLIKKVFFFCFQAQLFPIFLINNNNFPQKQILHNLNFILYLQKHISIIFLRLPIRIMMIINNKNSYFHQFFIILNKKGTINHIQEIINKVFFNIKIYFTFQIIHSFFQKILYFYFQSTKLNQISFCKFFFQ
ncbi:hypothetical protein IMG5_106530 [Ichthyophthirius multifiliis]|uniref:Transmembrane protein n=1 Tax=Ichthyophthirius multifiliis TaxID=5932 RepID=G0QT75_ICHMU|nr:hypothetical protein IMG5_106530 [Ichthyophthirius multifiliis]EGR31600.1 hypothetical protein IMG5_106530 [Ichthyophthirius multifiliis]|eukprot:XP_004035086.1 hypothetical protein IMG5_106530 [Ichthyophthirius multifiliis]